MARHVIIFPPKKDKQIGEEMGYKDFLRLHRAGVIVTVLLTWQAQAYVPQRNEPNPQKRPYKQNRPKYDI